MLYTRIEKLVAKAPVLILTYPILLQQNTVDEPEKTLKQYCWCVRFVSVMGHTDL